MMALTLPGLCCLTKGNSQQAAPVYPRITAYVGLLHPIVTISKDSRPHYNFDGSYVAGLPTGINFWKTSKIGLSLEFVPFIRADNGTSKMSNFLFHPGVLFGLGKGFTLATRAAFETSGRFGVTPVINKIIKKTNSFNYFIAMPFPARFGNQQTASLGAGLQLGIIF